MLTDHEQTLARCRALALAKMIEAGGKPCWVAVEQKGPIQPRSAETTQRSARPRETQQAQSCGCHAGSLGLTQAEQARFGSCSGDFVRALDRLVGHLRDHSAPVSPRRSVAGGRLAPTA